MKNLIVFTAFMAMLFNISLAKAQNFPAGVRMEVVSVEQDDNDYGIFGYKDDDETCGYYLSLALDTRILREIFGSHSIVGAWSNYREICLYLGSSQEDVLNKLDALLELYDLPAETEREHQARFCAGAEKLGDDTTIVSVVKKKFLGGKRLSFFFNIESRTVEVDLYKSSVKTLRKGFKIGKKPF